ncbi:MAG TPA: hypothetical protein VGL63_17630 [Streptosporangiaceae bacterium]
MSGTISTVAGGPGGPATATSVGIDPCSLSQAGPKLYVADGGSVREVNGNDFLTTPAGTGTGTTGPADYGVLATGDNMSTCGVTVDAAGNVLIADQAHFQVAVAAAKTGTFYGQAMTAGEVYLLAGDGQQGVPGTGVVATQTPLTDPEAVAVDQQGNVVIADSGFSAGGTSGGSRLQVVAASTGTFYGQPMIAGDLYTVAGNGKLAYSGDGGPATAAGLGLRVGEARVDSAGNLVMADFGECRIRVVAAGTGTFYDVKMTAGDIYTVAGNGTCGFSSVRGLPDGLAVKDRLNSPQGVALDPAGNLLIADTLNNRIRVVANTTGTFYGQAMTIGNIYTVAGNGTHGFAGDGGSALAAEFALPDDMVTDTAGNLVIADSGNDRLRVVAAATGTFYGQAMTAGDVYTVAGTGAIEYSGDGGPAGQAEFLSPHGVASDAAGDMLIADNAESRVRFVPAVNGNYFGQRLTGGNVYSLAGTGTQGFSGDGGPGTAARVGLPAAVSLDAAGNAIIVDTGNNRVRVVADTSGTFYGQAMTAGDIYTVAGTGGFGFSGDGGPAVGAELAGPQGVAVDGAGNLVITDSDNFRVRVVADTSGTFYGQAMTAGDIYTVAGNGVDGFAGDGHPATSAEFDAPVGVAVDRAGNLVITDTDNCRVRVVAVATGTFYGKAMTAGNIYAVAGAGTAGFSGDGGRAAKAMLHFPSDVAVDGTGNLVITDTGNERVRVVAEKAGTFYGQTMIKNDIYTVAGTGAAQFSGDGGPGTGAALSGPASAAVTGTGNLLIADAGNTRVRMVAG